MKFESNEGTAGKQRGPRVSCVPGLDRQFFPYAFTNPAAGVRRAALNPGDIANLHERITHLRPLWFEGFQLNVSKGFGVHRTVGASWTLSHVTPTGFRFGGRFQHRCDDSVLKTPLVAFDVNPSSLSSNLQFLYRPVRSLCLELGLQLRPNEAPHVEELSLQHTGTSRTSTVRCCMPGSLDSYRLSVDHLVSLTNRLCVGVEVLCEGHGEAQRTSVAFAGRYNRETWTLAATVSPFEAFDLSYWQKASSRLQLGSSLIVNLPQRRALGSICYRYENPGTVLRGSFDSDWTVGFTYGRKLMPDAFSLCLSLLFCIPKNTFQCGFRIDLDSNLL
ncbi:mitochondrial import receptor subunit TOM40 homolog [Anopheles ziemanni]|uniref:mitochondrial import receptor subunit TOM40 homolog n=1 Tax=Anopheles coustani TaxID=139045 RepID=UPI002659B26D|nr:mitochondrial import receptor subunit TOM40 homolog [Anopheles coustani]XP_058169886.1 mitochondrial import receptor subunit TOM40 homolog [Anopheles ziemanni]